jgi:hypothetical protein
VLHLELGDVAMQNVLDQVLDFLDIHGALPENTIGPWCIGLTALIRNKRNEIGNVFNNQFNKSFRA